MYQLAAVLADKRGTVDGKTAAHLKKELMIQVPEMIERIYKEERELLRQGAQAFLEARCYTCLLYTS